MWLSSVETGSILVVLHDIPLYPQSIWASLPDDNTWTLSMPVLKSKDQVVVLDVLNDERDPNEIRTFAALVVTHLGVGCVLLLEKHFMKI
jgi:hypothetical protein